MEKKFNVGDKVTYLPDDMQGEITAVHSRGLYGVKYPDEDDSFTVNEADLEFAEPKTAFLTDLADVLRKHNAVINVGWNDGWQADDAKYPLIDMDILFNDSVEGICLEDVLGKSLTADNIMDYEKE